MAVGDEIEARSRFGWPRARKLTALALAPAVLALVAGTTPGAAKPLDKPACEDLEAEAGRLTAAGAASDLEKGPAWGVANLSPDRIGAVKRLIEVNEQLSFRCMRSRITVNLKTEEAEQDTDGPPLPQRPAKRPARPKADARPDEGAAGSAAARQAARPRPTVKPPVNDAYSPAAAGVRPAPFGGGAGTGSVAKPAPPAGGPGSPASRP